MNSLFRAIQASSHAVRGFLHLTWSFFSLWLPLCLYSPFILIEIFSQTLLASWWLYLNVIVNKETKKSWYPFILLSWKTLWVVPFLLFVIRSITYSFYIFESFFIRSHQQQSKVWMRFCIFVLTQDWKYKMKTKWKWLQHDSCSFSEIPYMDQLPTSCAFYYISTN